MTIQDIKRTIKLPIAVIVVFFAILGGGAATTVHAATNIVHIDLKLTDGSDITYAVNVALLEAHYYATEESPYLISIPEGNYTISSRLRMFSNTTLDATGATINYSSEAEASSNLIMAGYSADNKNASFGGYNGYSNITVVGGTWISPLYNKGTIIRFAHGKNITISDVTLSGGGCAHQMEVCAINGFTVIGCTFENLKAFVNRADKQEALQLDIPCSPDVFKEVYDDGTVMKNVLVSGCTFKNVPRGVGTHTALLGAYHENIVITNNTFIDVGEEAIIGLNYYNSQITNNTIINCGGGILFQYFKANLNSVYASVTDGSYVKSVRHDAKTVISGNTISIAYTGDSDEYQGIKIYGYNLTANKTGAYGKTIPAGDYYISNVTVENNTINTAGHGVHLMDAKNCKIQNNIINGKGYSAKDANATKYDGIFLEQSSLNAKIYNNHIKNIVRNGILLTTASTANQISDNVIQDTGRFGIGLYSACKMTGNITNNTISNTRDSGISISTKSTVGEIKSNQINNVKGSGIVVYSECTVLGNISLNTLCDIGYNASKNSNAISISTKSKVNGSINQNIITRAKNKYSCKQGILLYKASSVKKGITNNHVIANEAQGIIILSILNNMNIASNQISDGAGNGILIHPGTARYKITINNNVITATSRKYAIHAIDGYVSIVGNTVTKKSLKIKIDKAVKGSVDKNIIK